MKIEKLSCDQFAGILDRSIEFRDGLNLIVGRNESGKSTLVDLLYYLFFQDALIDGRRDKAFKDRYFPRSVGAYQGDTIDGTVCFTGKDGSYKLKKEWSGRNGGSRLTLPDGSTIRDGKTIAGILAEQLSYGRGIYDEFVFSSQKRTQTVLQSLLGGDSSEAVKELAGTISKAVMETGGVDLDKMEAELDALIRSCDGRWDFSADLPSGGVRRGLKNRWTVGVGSILEAYYALEEVRTRRDEAEEKERAFERAADDLQKSKARQEELERDRTAFNEIRARLEQKKNIRDLLLQARSQVKETADALGQWPEAESALGRAEALRAELEQARKKQTFDEASGLRARMADKERALLGCGEVSEAEVRDAERSLREIDKLEARLSGVRLSARVMQLGTEPVVMRSMVTGEERNVSGEVEINGAVEFCVPGVVDIQLTPEGVDLSDVQEKLAEHKAKLDALLARFQAASVDELRSRQSQAESLRREIALLGERLRSTLQGSDWEQLQREAAVFPADLPAPSALEREVRELCGRESIEVFIGSKRNTLQQYAARYGSMDALREKHAAAAAEAAERERALEAVSEIPPAFASIRDPDQYAGQLESRIREQRDKTEALTAVWSEAYRALDDTSAEEYAEDLRRKEQVFEEQKAVCRHWMHIREVFLRLRQEMKGNPAAGIEEAFRSYLAAISGSALKLETVSDKLETRIVSGRHPLSVEILSEGTKDTISLAFRLAVLEHLYPDGGAVAVFDDPFTDMDPARVAEACRLIQKFAEKNQVIFVSCDEKYCELLGCSCIRI